MAARGHTGKEESGFDEDLARQVLAFACFLGGFTGDTERRYRAGLQAGDSDFVPALFAQSVGAALDPIESIVDFRQQLAFAVTDTQFQRPIGLGGRSICWIGKAFHRRLVHRVDGALRLGENLAFAIFEDASKLIEFPLSHLYLTANLEHYDANCARQ